MATREFFRKAIPHRVDPPSPESVMAETPSDPVTPIPAPQFMTLTTEQFAMLLGARQDSDEFLRKKAEIDAEAMRRVTERDNRTFPHISVYNPEGDYVKGPLGTLIPNPNPKPALVCEVFWVGYPETADVLTREEVTLLNALVEQSARNGFQAIDTTGGTPRPCARYKVKKTDGSYMDVTVSAITDGQTISRLEVYFPCRGDDRHNVPSKTAMLQQMLGTLPLDQDAMLAEIARLRALLEGRAA